MNDANKSVLGSGLDYVEITVFDEYDVYVHWDIVQQFWGHFLSY